MFYTTPLGRSVDNGTDFQGDVALKILYDFQSSGVSEVEECRFTIENLYQGSAMGMDEAREITLHLASLGFVIVDGEKVKLTTEGMMHVRKLIDESMCSKCGR